MNQLYWIPTGSLGRLAIAARPRGGDWLAGEIDDWKATGATLVVSLLEPDEVKEGELEHESMTCRSRGLAFVSYRIPDRGVPTSRHDTVDFARELAAEIRSGGGVVVHCRQGIGRSATIAAAVLVQLGSSPEKALEAVQQARGREIPDTQQQRDWVLSLSPHRTIDRRSSD